MVIGGFIKKIDINGTDIYKTWHIGTFLVRGNILVLFLATPIGRLMYNASKIHK